MKASDKYTTSLSTSQVSLTQCDLPNLESGHLCSLAQHLGHGKAQDKKTCSRRCRVVRLRRRTGTLLKVVAFGTLAIGGSFFYLGAGKKVRDGKDRSRVSAYRGARSSFYLYC